MIRNHQLHPLARQPRRGQEKLGQLRQDPEWMEVRKESEANGKLVAKVDSIFMDAIDYSPMK